MNSEDVMKAIGKPNLLKLQEVAEGIEVGVVFGDRVLVRPIKPYTDMDRVEKVGTLFIPETVKDANTPAPSTGVVVKVGDGVAKPYRHKLPVGTFVMFSRYAGGDYIVDHEEFKILEFREILCTLVAKDV